MPTVEGRVQTTVGSSQRRARTGSRVAGHRELNPKAAVYVARCVSAARVFDCGEVNCRRRETGISTAPNCRGGLLIGAASVETFGRPDNYSRNQPAAAPPGVNADPGTGAALAV